MAFAGTPLHDPNPQSREPFPLFVIEVDGGQANIARRAIGRLHWHDDLQLTRVLSGTADIDCSGTRMSCLAGQGLLVNAGAPHRIMGREGCQHVSLLFPAKLLGFFPGSEMAAFCVDPYVGPGAQPFCLLDGSEEWHVDVLGELELICQLLRDPTDERQRYEACARLTSAWGAYVANVHQQLPTDAQRTADERLKACVAFIEANHEGHVTLVDIAAAAGISKSECARVFRRCLQTSPYAYLTDVRLSHAMTLMQEGDLTLTAIAHKVGFGSPSHFSNAFKKAMGTSPKAYLYALSANADPMTARER